MIMQQKLEAQRNEMLQHQQQQRVAIEMQKKILGMLLSWCTATNDVCKPLYVCMCMCVCMCNKC
jgi:hypothetical protein